MQWEGNSCIVSKERTFVSCVLGRLCLDANVSYETMQTILTYHNIEIDMLETEHGLFKKFLESHENIFAETASDLRILDFEICCQINKMSIL